MICDSKLIAETTNEGKYSITKSRKRLDSFALLFISFFALS